MPVNEVSELLGAAVSRMGGQERAGQQEMARRVSQAIADGNNLLVQAGTGTGKSLGYLVPLVQHSYASGKPMVVSTATLALQSQILNRDLPRLLEALDGKIPHHPKVAVAKGRANYVCKNKLEGGYPEENTSESAMFELPADHEIMHPARRSHDEKPSALAKEVLRLRKWAQTTVTGDRDELEPGVSDKAWRQVSVNAYECVGASRCPLAQECFSELARREAAEADIVVTNHALLAVDKFGDANVLPEFDVVVVDEAHELVDKVSNSLSGHLTAQMVRAASSAIRRQGKVDGDRLTQAADQLERCLNARPNGLIVHGVDAELTEVVTAVLLAAKQALSDSKPEGKEVDGGLQIARSRVQAVFDLCEQMLKAEGLDSHWVLWVSRDHNDDHPQPELHVAPLDVAFKLKESLFDEHVVVATSATLMLGKDFGPVVRSFGLADAHDVETVDVGSPFDYPKQGILYVASHLPVPGPDLSPQMLDELERLLLASNGGVLGLFSSRRAAEKATAEMRARTKLTILKQGEDSMSHLVKAFRKDRDASLFGTMSLWQGVDVPGDSCRLVVMDRIPFPRPDDPLNTARTHAVNSHGGNGFMSVSATQAAVRMAQGAGRLIRSVEDKGVVAVLDSRLHRKSYGNFLRSTMPDFWYTTDTKTVLGALERLKG